MSRKLAVAMLSVFSLGLGGCPLILVGAGMAGGYAISKDAVRNTYDLPREAIYRASLSAIKEMGQAQVEDAKHGLIRAKVGDVNVTITVKPVTKRAVELKVKARNALLMPSPDIAQEVYNKINGRLK